MTCIYLGEKQGHHHNCYRHGKCKPGGTRKAGFHGCPDCEQRLELNDDSFSDKWDDPMLILDRHRVQTKSLQTMLAGRDVFLAAGGPSANDLPLEQLGHRGAWTMTVNNMGGHARFRPQAFVCSDPPLKFSHCIWRDPAIMKFLPTPKMTGHRAYLKEKQSDGIFNRMTEKVLQMPNVWGFKRYSWMYPNEQFFATDGACWGNHNAGVKKTGESKTVCTFLLALRLLKYLGAGKIFLIGVDFHMAPDKGYAFPQGRTAGASQSNNGQFRIVNQWLCEMKNNGTFAKFGMEIFNCNETSGLRAFPYVPFDVAFEMATEGIQNEPDLVGWYEKNDGKKKEEVK